MDIKKIIEDLIDTFLKAGELSPEPNYPTLDETSNEKVITIEGNFIPYLFFRKEGTAWDQINKDSNGDPESMKMLNTRSMSSEVLSNMIYTDIHPL